MSYKKILTVVFALAVSSSFILAGCNNNSYSGDVNLSSNKDSVSYAVGYNIGKNMHKNGMDDLEVDVLAKALNQAMNGDTSAISQTKMVATLRSFQMKARDKMQKKQMKQAKMNKENGQNFLTKNKQKEGVKTTESGLQYKVIKQGSGPSPDSTDKVLVNYKGTLLNGKVFDQNDSTTIPLNRVIPGWTEGIQLMKTGATYKFWIPGELAYGSHPRPGGPIGPNQTLVFNVHLLKIVKSKSMKK